MTTERTAWDERYRIEDASTLATPCLVVFPDLVRDNIEGVIRIAGEPDRLRPHVKTHKSMAITRLQREAGISKYKCATLAEAEMLAATGVASVLLAYPLVGPNIPQFMALQRAFPETRFATLVDHPSSVGAFSKIATETGQVVELMLDLDVGMGRTGITVGESANALYRAMAGMPGIRATGLHVYGGHINHPSIADRQAAVDRDWKVVSGFVRQLESQWLPVSTLVCGGSPTFPQWAKLATSDRRIECSPGTLFLNDWHYFRDYADLPFRPAVVLLTRVVSMPRPNCLTLDLGYKAVACDSPLADRVLLIDFPEATFLRQSEEHLTIETPLAENYSPGDLLYALPGHVCPTVALYPEMVVVENHRSVGRWRVDARDRLLPLNAQNGGK